MNNTDTIYCPVCDWAEPALLRDRCKIDPDCEGCGTKKWSEFGERVDRDPADWWKNNDDR